VVSDTRELHAALKFGMSKHLTAHSLVAHVFRVDANLLCDRINMNDARRKASLKLFRKMRRYRLLGVEDDVREQTIRGSG